MEVLKILQQGRAFQHYQIKTETLCQAGMCEQKA